MSPTVEQLMTVDPITVFEDATVQDAAELMRDADIGDVIVLRKAGTVSGIVTDRDLVVRALAAGSDPKATSISDICDDGVVSVSPLDATETAVELMRKHNIRRLPVVDGDKLVGIVTLGDLAIDRDPSSALADISKAPPNN